MVSIIASHLDCNKVQRKRIYQSQTNQQSELISPPFMPIADFKFTRIKSFVTQDGRYPFKLTLQ